MSKITHQRRLSVVGETLQFETPVINYAKGTLGQGAMYGILMFKSTIKREDLIQRLKAEVFKHHRLTSTIVYQFGFRGSINKAFFKEHHEFNLEEHVIESILNDHGTEFLTSIQEYIELLMTRHLCPAKPLWEVYLVHSSNNQESAIVLRIHHSLGDGPAGIAFLLSLADKGCAITYGSICKRRRCGNMVPRHYSSNPILAFFEMIIQFVVNFIYQLYAIYCGAVCNLMIMPDDTQSPVRSTQKYEAAVAITTATSLSKLKSLKKDTDATLTAISLDLYTAALQRFLLGKGITIGKCDTLRMSVSFDSRGSTKNEDSEMLSNRSYAFSVHLPIGEMDEAGRLNKVIQSMHFAQTSREHTNMAFLYKIIKYIPDLYRDWVFHTYLRQKVTGLISNVKGPAEELRFFGEPVDHIYVFLAMKRTFLGIISYNGKVSFALTANLPKEDATLIMRYFQEEIDNRLQ